MSRRVVDDESAHTRLNCKMPLDTPHRLAACRHVLTDVDRKVQNVDQQDREDDGSGIHALGFAIHAEHRQYAADDLLGPS